MSNDHAAQQVELSDLEVAFAPASLRARASFAKTHGRRSMEAFPVDGEDAAGEQGDGEDEVDEDDDED